MAVAQDLVLSFYSRIGTETQETDTLDACITKDISGDPSNLRTGQWAILKEILKEVGKCTWIQSLFSKKKMLPSVNTGKWAKEKERKKETTGDLDQDALHREKRVVLFERFYFSLVRFPCRFRNITQYPQNVQVVNNKTMSDYRDV